MSSKSIAQLKAIWKQEKEEYKYKEVGSGVQKFVKYVLSCDELFNLKEGRLNVLDIKRKNEFLEEPQKKGRRADIVIFIDGDITIPVEVEKYKNIEAGEQQLFAYQADWIKKYGLLTDGEIWRFYNNRFPEKSFQINDILNNPNEFKSFWNEYIQPDYYYLSFFEKKGQQEIFELPPPNLDDVREDFFNDITKLIENFEHKLNLKGYFKKETEELERKKKAVEITYAFLIQFILYKVLVDNSFADFEQDWKYRLNSIFHALKSQSYKETLILIKSISDKISAKIYKRFNDEQLMINDRLKDILEKPETDIKDVSVWLDILLFINRYNFANVQNEIFGYVYENYLKDLYLDEKKGQYFTDPNVVEFMLNEIGYNKENLSKRYYKDNESISIIDPACGSGTFLYNATNRIVDSFYKNNNSSARLSEKIINENVYGLDISEFPLYLAEMNILMRMLTIIINEKYNNPVKQKIKVFKTRDSIAEFLDTNFDSTDSDKEISASKKKEQYGLFEENIDLGYDSFVRDKNDLNELKSSLEYRNKKKRYRFDYVIGNPPYITYNECSKQKILFVELLQNKQIQMSNIYGINLNTVPGRIKAYAPKPNLYSFFIALGFSLLKNEGKLCYIIPQNILTSSDQDVIRYFFSNFCKIDKIVTFSSNMFVDRGIKQTKVIPTSSLIFIVTKTPYLKSFQTEIINYININDDVSNTLKNISKGKGINRRIIKQEELKSNIDNWNFIKYSDDEIKFMKEYNANDNYDIYRMYSESEKRFNDRFYFDKGLLYDKKKICTNTPKTDYYTLIDTMQKTLVIKTLDEYIETRYLVFPKGAQGLKVYNAKYKIIWRYMNTNSFMYSEENVMFNNNWILISSNNKTEITYLLAILNSKINFKVLELLFSNDNEKSFQIGIKSIKEFGRIPIITKSNSFIKEEIISKVEELIRLESTKLQDFIKFDKIFIQKYDSLYCGKGYLVIVNNKNEYKLPIKSKPDLINNIIADINLNGILGNNFGSIQELKNLITFDKIYQNELKSYIDDLVYALYFNINLKKLGFIHRDEIKKVCQKHKFYKLVHE